MQREGEWVDVEEGERESGCGGGWEGEGEEEGGRGSG